MKGDRERCLQAGMDGYISKPVQPRELFEALDRLVPATAAGPEGAAGTAPGEALDRREALAHVGGDPGLLRELARLFLDTFPGQMVELQAALDRNDQEKFVRTAHTLKGAVAIFAARTAIDAAGRVERLGRAGELASARPACADLAEALDHLRPALAALAAEGGG
jgi:HPt (histidine-containing phosphotransfer) domain-containing protein